MAWIGAEKSRDGAFAPAPVPVPAPAHPSHTLVPPSFPSETPASRIEAAFKEFTSRPDVAVVLVNQHVRSGGGVGAGLWGVAVWRCGAGAGRGWGR